jgi:hypothetical protein
MTVHTAGADVSGWSLYLVKAVSAAAVAAIFSLCLFAANV